MYKTEHWLPDHCNRDDLDAWLLKGRKDWAAMSTEKARELLKTHTPARLSDTAAATLTEIRKEAESKLKDHSFAT
jgi:trimethylamine:corrinoid methyltransferase-like protein